jgi:hypothetical protein
VVIDFVAHFTRGHYRINISVRDPRAGVFMMTAESVATFAVDEQATYDGVVDVEAKVQVHQPANALAITG